MTRRLAALDIGSNSTRLLVADADCERLEEVERLLTITRLGDGVDASGRLAEDAMQRVARCVGRYAERASELGAERPLAVATSAVRDAANGRDFLARLERDHGVRTRLLAGEDEARLTLRGVASGRAMEGPVVVCDIGGGSTELIAGTGDDVRFAISLDMGCVRLSERHLRDDPPTAEQVEAVREEVTKLLPDDVPPGDLIGVAGTITTLATIDLDLEEEVPELVDGHVLEQPTVEAELARLAGLPLEQRRSVRGLMPERAPTIVAGAAILAQLMAELEVQRLSVSERDILHGAALAAGDPGS
ncbi:MAG TPA: Ppx/GppA phosphatase family protein [Gaiellales bacterium]|nr:Ppx/GppA phosphatase family protein [Gaiellales bacterium]